MKATPGPWDFVYNEKQSMISIAQVGFDRDNDELDDKSVCGIWGVGGNSGKADSGQFANAKLIAAAPELLEALEAVMSEIDNGRLVRNIDKDHESGWAMKNLQLVQTLSKAVKAINKAKGETQPSNFCRE